VRHKGIGGVLLWTTVVGVAGAVAGACGPPEPYVRYSGSNFGRQPKPVEAMEIFRTSVPNGRSQDLGTVSVTCPAPARRVLGAIQAGGCYYEAAVRLAAERAASNGGDGIHAIETDVNGNGGVVSLRATVFVRLPPLVSAQAPQPVVENRKATVEERLRHLDKLKQDGLINQDEYDKKRQQILNDI
jgi:hypothetical protein